MREARGALSGLPTAGAGFDLGGEVFTTDAGVLVAGSAGGDGGAFAAPAETPAAGGFGFDMATAALAGGDVDFVAGSAATVGAAGGAATGGGDGFVTGAAVVTADDAGAAAGGVLAVGGVGPGAGALTVGGLGFGAGAAEVTADGVCTAVCSTPLAPRASPLAPPASGLAPPASGLAPPASRLASRLGKNSRHGGAANQTRNRSTPTRSPRIFSAERAARGLSDR
jgi:hypothetical protein